MSKIETWIQSTIAALSIFDTNNVDLYGGVPKFESSMDALRDIREKREPAALIVTTGFQRNDLGAEGDADFVHRVTVFIAVKDPRQDGAQARIGEDATHPGTNLLIEEVTFALDNQESAQAGPRYSSLPLKVISGQLLTLEKGFSPVEIVLHAQVAKKA